jgi:hypothetical protein
MAGGGPSKLGTNRSSRRPIQGAGQEIRPDAEPSREARRLHAVDRDVELVRLIETEIVPRLLLSVTDPGRRAPVSTSTCTDSPLRQQVIEFTRVLLHGDRHAAGAYIRSVRRDGMPLARICVEVFAPAARHLCGCWERRECSFGEVAPALIRLLSTLREVSGAQH